MRMFFSFIHGFVLTKLVAALLAFIVLCVPVQAASLWTGSTKSLYTVNHSWHVDDLVTVVIVEQAQATQTAGTETSKKSGANVGVELPIGALQALGGSVDADISGGDSLKSSGKTVRGGSLTARLTAKVVEVLPNGNLKIEGRQAIVLNGETQEIILSGYIRPEDVDADNTVLSSFISDAQIAYKGAGTLGSKQEQGLITRFFHWLF